MKENFVNEKVYIPLLEQFCKENIDLYSCNYPWGPFIPYTMPNYSRAKKKIFYMGRDSYYWVDKSELLKAYSNNKLNNYLDCNKNCVTTDTMLAWKNNTGSFWSFVVKLHLFLTTGIMHNDITNLTLKDMDFLSEIGYGNLNAIELPETLIKEDNWESIFPKQENYFMLKKNAHPFESIKNIINAYHPDIIFVLSWTDREDVFDNLEVKFENKYYNNQLSSVYTIEQSNTKIIWSSHPQRHSFLRTNYEKVIKLLGNIYMEII